MQAGAYIGRALATSVADMLVVALVTGSTTEAFLLPVSEREASDLPPGLRRPDLSFPVFR